MRHCLLSLPIILFWTASCLAEPAVFFRGDRISREHIIYGSIDTERDSVVTINLGYAHGVLVGNRWAVVRQSSGRMLPLGRVDVTTVRPGFSIGRFTGMYAVRSGDVVMIRAGELDLWTPGVNRTNRLLLNTVARIERGDDYDTRNISPALLDELARDDDALRLNRQPPSPFLTEAPVTPATIQNANVAGTFRPLAVASESGALRAPEEPLAYGGSPELEDQLALFIIQLRAGRFSMSLPENRELGGMLGVAASNVREIELRQQRLILQTRGVLVPPGTALISPDPSTDEH